jgi:hypothetical protein
MSTRNKILAARLSRKGVDMQCMVSRSLTVDTWVSYGGLLTPLGANNLQRETSMYVQANGSDTPPRGNNTDWREGMEQRGTSEYLLRLSERSDEVGDSVFGVGTRPEHKPCEMSLQQFKEPRVAKPGEKEGGESAIDGCISQLESWVQHKKLTKLKQKYAGQDSVLFEIQESD